MKRWPTMPVAPRIPTGSLFDMVSCDFIPAKKFDRECRHGHHGKSDVESGCGERMILASDPDNLNRTGTGLGSRLAYLVREEALVERSELAFFDVDAPAPPDDAQTGHYRDGEIDAEHSGDFAARENAEQSRQRMQFHTDSHDAGGDYVVLYHAPDDQKQKQESPV